MTKTLELSTWDQILLLDHLREQLRNEQAKVRNCAAALRDIGERRIKELEDFIDRIL